ncbi:MAG: MBOAT family O-acyltransferase [Bacteroidota bacterium]
MIFNSFSFLVFFVVIFFLYYFPLKEKTNLQNWLLLLASYFFYSYADWKMIPLLLGTTVIFYLLGIAIQTSTEKKASLYTTLGVFLGIGLLLYFKYLNFFIESFSDLFNAIGLQSNWGTFNIILPLGISFYTFRLISYILEVNDGKIEATRDFVSFATYVAFFPTILSGPIDRAHNFIPQLQTKRSFNSTLVVDGCRQILWGLFQKVVIADNLAGVINGVWSDIPSHSGSTLLITAILYSFQLYTDFSGYSHMAIGIGKILGFQITKNFNYPFFGRNIPEFWRNWHISLTTWLTDYIFMPLNFKFRAFGTWGIILAVLINLMFVGLWHGANWTFVVFGLYHGLLFVPLILSGSFLKTKKLVPNKLGLPTLNDFLRIIRTFMLVTMSLVIFRAENIGQAVNFLSGIFSPSIFTMPKFTDTILTLTTIVFIAIFMLIEWYGRDGQYAIERLGLSWARPTKWAFYSLIIFIIGMFMQTVQSPFLYFKF